MKHDTKGALAAPKPPEYLRDETRELERQRLKHAHIRPLTEEEVDHIISSQVSEDSTLLGSVAHALCGKPPNSTQH